ncbi:MAG TPA: amidohydrolase family protein, partial [Labilithrix sp.]|nr:amidohydrolase family protein [Labilithrix sp.]
MTERWLLRGATVVTCDDELGDLPRADILIEGGKIREIGTELSVSDARILALDDKLVMPGLIDTHRHTWQTPLRGLGADWTVMDYLAAVRVKLSPHFQPEDLRIANLAGALEALDAGITTLVDHSHCITTPEHADAALDGLEAARGRALFAYGFASGPTPSPELVDQHARIRDAGRLRRSRLSSEDRLVRMGVALTEMQVPWEQSRDEIRAARELGVPITLHCSAWPVDKSEVQLMANEGLLGPDILYVHCTFSSEDDLRAIRDSGGSISATPETELQMGMGFPVVGRALRANVRCSLGCDVVSSNGGDLFTAMRLAMQVERGAENARVGLPQSLPLKASRLLRMTTIDAAESMGLGDVTGSIRVGKDADLVVLSANAMNMTPLNRPRDAVVMQAHAGNVETVFVRGEPVKYNGVLLGQDLPEVRRRLIASRDAVLERAGGAAELLGGISKLGEHWDMGKGK